MQVVDKAQDSELERAAPPLHVLRKNPMSRFDVASLLILAGIWGSSFLFMRVATPEFGPVPLIEVRVVIASLFLLPVLAWKGDLREMRGNLRVLAVVGAVNSALPFSLLAFATLSLTAGFASILNATAPFFAAIVAFLWLGDRLSRPRVLGMVIGFLGVVLLVWGRASFNGDRTAVAVLAGLGAGVSYGVAANYTKVYLSHMTPLAAATGSQVAASVCLLPLALTCLPAALPSLRSWMTVASLGVLCTGIAYILYFRLIARVGPARAVAVTFLVPAFAMLWGGIFLKERVTLQMLIGTVVILLGTSLTTGLLKISRTR